MSHLGIFIIQKRLSCNILNENAYLPLYYFPSKCSTMELLKRYWTAIITLLLGRVTSDDT